jgi:3-(3-hydroxy-phenyl)propionate hydroxylase
MRDELRFPFVLQYEQYKLTASITAEYANAGDFDVRFSHCLTDLVETADGIEVEVALPAGVERLRADYVIGCDGGRSTVRKLADIEFDGFTYPERFIKTATSFDFGTVNSNIVFRNYFSDPVEWCNLFKVQGKRPPGLWRAIFPIGPEEDDATALDPERIEARLHKFFPKSGRYEVEYVNVYGAHQRVAASFRKGRVLLAGDSAHVNNPIGGMGMNGGIHDGINLADKLARVIHGEADDDLLDLYSRQRRHAAVKYVQAQTIANKRLMEERDPAVRKTNFDELRRTADNPETARAYMRRAALLDSLRDAAAVT